jgi:BirA family biotin operon repressor/biotin-[acetyl-CoA-carboxylase] ligase
VGTRVLRDVTGLPMGIWLLATSGMMQSMANNLLCADRVIKALPTAVREVLQVAVYDTVGSTNDVLHGKKGQVDLHGAVVIANQQTDGRGRRGRRWCSPAGANLYCSMGWRFNGSLEKLTGLSLAVGAMVAEQIKTHLGVDLQLKWPNDLYYNEQKLGGILVEVLGDDAGGQSVVIGLGLNVNMPEEEGASIERPWTDLRSAVGAEVDRHALAGTVLAGVADGLAQFAESGFAHWHAVWCRRDYLSGRSIVIDGTPPIAGIACGVDASGALLVESEAGQLAIAGGEANLLEIGAAS